MEFAIAAILIAVTCLCAGFAIGCLFCIVMR